MGKAATVLALNSGSSTIKYALFSLAPEPQRISGATLDAARRHDAVDDIFEQIAPVLATAPLQAIGHRIVHGGPELSAPARVTPDLLEVLRSVVRFAPNHLPQELDLIDEVATRLPDVPQFVCFDTAFHAALPDVARELPVSRAHAAQGVRRYGFHGLSYASVLDDLQRRRGPLPPSYRTVLAHLGSGSSLAAVRGTQCVDTTMGFTPLGGVVMSTRPGDLDPGVVTHLARESRQNISALEHELSHQSGLLGLSGRSGDMRDLLAREATDERCRLAVAVYCYEIRKRIGAYAAALGGMDALVFSGGIGERSPLVRSRICEGLEFLGIDIHQPSNAAGHAVISKPGARTDVHVVAADEEMVIARAAALLSTSP